MKVTGSARRVSSNKTKGSTSVAEAVKLDQDLLQLNEVVIVVPSSDVLVTTD